MAALRISNRAARHLWLWSSGLAPTPVGPLDIMGIIRQIGFLQIDTIRNVTRAHNHILWSRNQNYREGAVWDLLSARQLFEHFTHDASLIPAEMLPNWGRQFRRLGEKTARDGWYNSGLGQAEVESIRKRIEAEGALSTHAFDSKAEGREMWARPPHKKALDQMWYAGELATCHRENFVKFYDLGDRVFPSHLRHGPDEGTQAVNLCNHALDLMGIATTGEVKNFWDAMPAREAQGWAAGADLIPVEIEGADKAWRKAWGAPDIEARLAACPVPTTRLRILNPFDPAIRDRMRLARLFGFDYRNEMFVPPAKRIWGYYVYPLLEGDRFVGRCELKGDRKTGILSVTGFWPEPGIKWGSNRTDRMTAELGRFARFASLSEVVWTV